MCAAKEEKPKRKRDIIPEDEDDKLEIDVNLPEPPSKKAKRKEKKQAKQGATTPKTNDAETTTNDETKPPKPDTDAVTPAKRSEHGIWVGNLPFNANKDALRKFLKDHGSIDENDITRLHMPAGNSKQNNQGFAYVDFSSDAVLQIALALSEKLLNGRALLIKNANSFAGRPEKPAAVTAESSPAKSNGKEPSKRVFVGNLSFDVTKEDLAEHFSQAGEVEDVFMATFQDSGKCKGFAWVRFADLKAAESAVKGYVLKKSEDEDEEQESGGEDDESAAKKNLKPEKPQRYYINRIQGRQIRCEFAEDAQTRYKKRFSKGRTEANGDAMNAAGDGQDAGDSAAPTQSRKRPDRNLSKDERQEMRRKRHDARTIAPGKALAGAHRASTAIVAAEGKKTTFD